MRKLYRQLLYITRQNTDNCGIIKALDKKMAPAVLATPRSPAHKETLMDTTSVAYVLCRIEDDASLTPISEHEDIVDAVAAGKHTVRLDYEDLLIRETSRSRIRPDIPPNPICEIFVEASILDTVLSHMDASGSGQPFHAFWVIGLPVGVRIRLIRLTLVSKWLRVCGRSLTSEITRLV